MLEECRQCHASNAVFLVQPPAKRIYVRFVIVMPQCTDACLFTQLTVCDAVLDGVKWGVCSVRRANLLKLSKRFVPGSLVGIKDIDFVGRSEAETP